MPTKMRLDKLLTERGLARSRTAANVLIDRGSVTVDGIIATKASQLAEIDARIEVTKPLQFVSRAGEKLQYALSEWNISTAGLVVADIGASTGGFTDCLLQNGAQKVYAIDVGTNQLSPELKENPKVVSVEQTDVRKACLPEKVDLATIDVSFISLTYVLPTAAAMLKKGGTIIALVKPQFEVGPGQVDRRGVVTEEAKREEVLEKIKAAAQAIGFSAQMHLTSPVPGTAGNIEYLLWLRK